MSVTTISPKYSFVNFNSIIEDKCCVGESSVALPVIEETDLVFQIKLNTETIAESNFIYAMPIASFQLLLYSGVGNISLLPFQNLVRNWTVADNLFFERYRTGATEITFLWRKNLKDIKTLIPCNECFEIAFYIPVINFGGGAPNQSVLHFSNVFVRKCNDCFTSVLEYANNENYADFEYCNITNPINRVRLYMYLSQPKSIEDKAVYRKSNGVIRQTRSLITKEYTAQTEHFNELLHDKIVIALAHDLVNVVTDNYNGGISKTGDYDIEWTDNICLAPAKFKVLATPYAIRNNNCADCEPVNIPSTCVAIADIDGLATADGCAIINNINGFTN
jgi:hypothetical protein